MPEQQTHCACLQPCWFDQVGLCRACTYQKVAAEVEARNAGTTNGSPLCTCRHRLRVYQGTGKCLVCLIELHSREIIVVPPTSS